MVGVLEQEAGRCLVSQQIRDRIVAGSIITNVSNLGLVQRKDEHGNPLRDSSGKALTEFSDKCLEARVQPCSFEPTLGDEAFVLDTETRGLFRPQSGEQVYRTLLQLPRSHRPRVKIGNGFELKKGFSYAIPLEERIGLGQGEYLESSTKSSFAGLFMNVRMMFDHNPTFNEANYQYCGDRALQSWLLVQPLAFNVVVYPGLALNHFRWFKGYNAQLSPVEIFKALQERRFLSKKELNGIVAADPIITNGLLVHLDLAGARTSGIVALRARRNPTPIDLRASKAYPAEDFFEPNLANAGRLRIRSGSEHYHLCSSEVLDTPPNMNMTLRDHPHVSFNGVVRRGDLVDNGYHGDFGYHVTSDEGSDVELMDGMPMCVLDIARTDFPDKLYGRDSGANYQGNIGLRTPKFFKPFDFELAARNYAKMSREVLVQDARELTKHRRAPGGFEPMSERNAAQLFAAIQNGFFQNRYDCEFDDSILQPIPYVVVFGPDGKLFSYVRAKNIVDYGDSRLFGKHSLGLGGHIAREDAPDYTINCIKRELGDEVRFAGKVSRPKFVGTLMQPDTDVDKVHFGLIYVVRTDESVRPAESSIVSGRMVPMQRLVDDPNLQMPYETWSRVLIPHLPMINKFSR